MTLGQEHRGNTLSWLAGIDDTFRLVKPRTPSPHLVSYFLLVDRPSDSVLLCDHRLSGLWLPIGGHVEPGEHPLDTVKREAAEELGVKAEPGAESGDRPFFLTMTETTGPVTTRHVDVSLWFALAGRAGQAFIRTSASSSRSGGGRSGNCTRPTLTGSIPTCCAWAPGLPGKPSI